MSQYHTTGLGSEYNESCYQISFKYETATCSCNPCEWQLWNREVMKGYSYCKIRGTYSNGIHNILSLSTDFLITLPLAKIHWMTEEIDFMCYAYYLRVTETQEEDKECCERFLQGIRSVGVSTSHDWLQF